MWFRSTARAHEVAGSSYPSLDGRGRPAGRSYGSPADSFAAEKTELQARTKLIVEALQCPSPAAPPDDAERVAAAIRKLHKAGGVPLSDAEAIEFITKRINFGRPQRSPKPAHGPWSRDTQYDLAYARRKGMYHKLLRLPSLRVGQGKIDLDRVAELAAKLLADGERDRDVLRLIFDRVSGKSGEAISLRDLRKARALLRKRGKWPKELPG